MDDRQSLYPGRVELTDVETGERKKYDMRMADEPTVEGTAPTKKNLLTDETEMAIFGGIQNRTVNDALMGLLSKISLIMDNSAMCSVIVSDQSGNPVPGLILNGITDENGKQLFTNESGKATGYVSEGNAKISINGYADIEDASVSFNAIKGSSYSKSITIKTRDYLDILSSKSVMFSPNVQSLDVTVLAAGGGGAAARHRGTYGVSFGGGAGGECKVQTGVSFQVNTQYSAVIGAGGQPGDVSSLGVDTSNGSNGGNSSFMGITSMGGEGGKAVLMQDATGNSHAGGKGNGDGGYAYKEGYSSPIYVQPTNGKVSGYFSTSETRVYGGGGQGGITSSNYIYYTEKSSSYGGKHDGDPDAVNGKDGYGSGGAGTGTYISNDPTPGKGGSGRVSLRMRLKST